jgi:hypothetical protein
MATLPHLDDLDDLQPSAGLLLLLLHGCCKEVAVNFVFAGSCVHVATLVMPLHLQVKQCAQMTFACKHVLCAQNGQWDHACSVSATSRWSSIT